MLSLLIEKNFGSGTIISLPWGPAREYYYEMSTVVQVTEQQSFQTRADMVREV